MKGKRGTLARLGEDATPWPGVAFALSVLLLLGRASFMGYAGGTV